MPNTPSARNLIERAVAMTKTRLSVSGAISLVPLTCYLTLVGAACYTYFVVGHWPNYDRPDPKDLPIHSIYIIAVSATLLGLASVPLCPIAELLLLTVRVLMKKHWTVHYFRIAAFYSVGAMIWIMEYLRWRSGDGGLVNWIFD